MSQAGRFFTVGGPGGAVIFLAGDVGGNVSPNGGGTIFIEGGHDINTVSDVPGNGIIVNLNNAITLGDVAPIAPGSPALTATTGDIVVTAGNITLPLTNVGGTQGAILAGGVPLLHDRGTGNLFVGGNAGNALVTLTGTFNTIAGSVSAQLLTSGNNNVIAGSSGLSKLTTGSNNSVLGTSGLTNLITGSNNISIGQGSASALAAAESSNIIIGNSAVVGDNNTIRIGTTGGGAGQQNLCFIAGITTVNVGSVASVVSLSGDQLGSTTITAGTNISVTPGANSITIAAGTAAQVVNYTGIAFIDSPYTALSTDYYISADVTAGVISILLPNAPATGRIFVVKDKVGLAAASNITVTTVGGVVNIDGATTFVMNTAYEAASFIFNGSSYEIY